MKSKVFHITMLLLLLTGVVSAQDDKRKDTYRSLKKLSSSRGASPLLNTAEELKVTDPARALTAVQDALALSIASDDRVGEARCYRLLGEINSNIGEWKLAAENYDRAYALGRTGDDYLLSVLGLARCYVELGDYPRARQYGEEALALATTDELRHEVRLQLAEVHFRTGDYTAATTSLDAITTEPNSSMDNRVQNLRAKIYARTNALDKTKNLYQNSINSLRGVKSPTPQEQQSLKEAKEEIVDVLREQKKYDDEIAIRQQAIDYNLESRNFSEVTDDKVAIGKTLEKKGEQAAAIRELQGAEKIADTLNDPTAQSRAYLALAEAYQKAGRTSQALSAYQKYSGAVTRAEQQRAAKLEERSALIRQQRDIEALSKDVSLGQREETIEQQTVSRQRLVIYGLLLIIAIVAVTSYFIYRSAQASKAANQLLALKSLRSQMNPHFIFNALNSVNGFIAQQDERAANRFLSEFSQLMRLVLENSQEDFIPLAKEQELLALYLKLEHYRFRDKFDYEITCDEQLPVDSLLVPPMLIQPYLENAVWHGLRYKEEKGKLTLHYRASDDGVEVIIEDDGIGRARSAALKTTNQKKHQSTGLKNISARVSILNKVYRRQYRVSVSDREGGGTRVNIVLPKEGNS